MGKIFWTHEVPGERPTQCTGSGRAQSLVAGGNAEAPNSLPALLLQGREGKTAANAEVRGVGEAETQAMACVIRGSVALPVLLEGDLET